MRRFRELDEDERVEFGSLVNGPWTLASDKLSVEDGADPPELREIAIQASDDAATDVSPILTFARQEYAELRGILQRSREEFRRARPTDGFRWRILLKVNERELEYPLPLDYREEVVTGPFAILGQRGPGRPRDRDTEINIIRRAYDLVEDANPKFASKPGVNCPAALVKQLAGEFRKERRYVRWTLERYLFELPIDSIPLFTIA